MKNTYLSRARKTFTIMAILLCTTGYAANQNIDKMLTSDGVQFRVVSKKILQKNMHTAIVGLEDSALILGFPLQLIGQQNVFGGVITAVSDHTDMNLGGLKLSDITPVHVKTELSADKAKLILVGCPSDCDENSEQQNLFEIPVLKIDDQFAYLDLTAFGKSLDIFHEAGDFSTSAIATQVTGFDFTLSTLVFDVENVYQNFMPPDQPQIPPFTLTTRWYLKLASGFNPSFTSRAPNASAGFFTTARGKNTLITRFAGATNAAALVKYYIKNVPTEYRAAFADSFKDWNTKLFPILNKNFFEYEFLDTTDPRYNQIIMGDVRYNVIEWDLLNLAGYGGLGPSIANQMTGETFSANVSIQGPHIVELYKKWWKVAAEVKSLEQQGNHLQAEKLKIKYVKEMSKVSEPLTTARASLGKLNFQIRSTDPRLRDTALDAADFIATPAGYTYETYMYGYFKDMVAHELGHNLGLRHNFRGSLGSDESGEIASVSRSVMEYLGRAHRHLDRVGPYDAMAVAYGYKGKTPEHSDWFCTDENQVSSATFSNSAECSSSDASNDPYGYLLSRFERVKEFLILPGSELAPVWTTEVLAPQIVPIVNGLANYYVSSFSRAAEWTNFNVGERKVATNDVPAYILSTISAEICDLNLDRLISQKPAAAQVAANKNLHDLRDLFKTLTSEYTAPNSGFTEANFPCLK